jgi:hypothetical protein
MKTTHMRADFVNAHLKNQILPQPAWRQDGVVEADLDRLDRSFAAEVEPVEVVDGEALQEVAQVLHTCGFPSLVVLRVMGLTVPTVDSVPGAEEAIAGVPVRVHARDAAPPRRLIAGHRLLDIEPKLAAEEVGDAIDRPAPPANKSRS